MDDPDDELDERRDHLSSEPAMVEITTEEEIAWFIAYGRVMIMTKPDGKRYRVLEPWERV